MKKKERGKEKKSTWLGWAGLGWAGRGGAGQEATERPSDCATARTECEKQSGEKDRSYGVDFTPSALYG